MPTVRRHPDVREFLDHAGSWMLRHEVEHNLLLGITDQLLRDNHSFEEPIYLATIEVGGDVAGCAFRTPPFKLGLTRLPLSAMSFLVRDVAAVYEDLPSVLGPEQEATRFAGLWCRQHGCRATPGMRQGIHSLEAVVPPAPCAAGALRHAEPRDRPLVRDWVEALARDVGTRDSDPFARAEHLMSSGSLRLWEDGGPKAMAGVAGSTPNSVRIGYVYTPPPFRRHGYATAAVASLSQRLLDEGYRYCCLYTDQANPTSNAIYRRIGYEQVCEVIDVGFSA